MINPAVTQGILRVGSTLKSLGSGFKKSATDFGSQSFKRSKSKIEANAQILENKKQKSTKLDEETEELLRREGREDLIEKNGGKKKASGLLRKNLIEKPVSILKSLIGAWLIRNAPIIIREIEIFTKKVRVFLATIKRLPGAVVSVVGATLNWAKVFVQNLANFDLDDRRKKMEAASKEFDREVKDANVTFGELSTVWGREERELDLMLEKLTTESTITEAIEYADEYASQDIDTGSTQPQPQNPMVGPGAGMATGAAPAATQISSGMGFGDGEWDVFRNTIAKIESGGDYSARGGSGGHYDGRYQMGADAKTDAAKYLGEKNPGHTPEARAAFRADPAMQERYFAAYTLANHEYLMRNPKYQQANKQRRLQILGYAHNQGMANADTWLNTGEVGDDGFGTKGTVYSDSIAQNFRNQDTSGGLGADMVAKGDQAIAAPTEPAVQAPQPANGASGSMTNVLTAKDFNTTDRSVPSPIIKTSGFGMRGGRMHRGIDFAPPNGQRGWYCAYNANGKVMHVGSLSGYGKTVIINFGNVDLVFAHLASYSVRNGDRYTAGSPIGEIGNTGRSSGTHLHFEARPVGGIGGTGYNPEQYVNGLTFGRMPSNTGRATRTSSNLSPSRASNLGKIASRPTGGTQVVTNVEVFNQKEVVLVG